jgi:cytochrome c-type biogenesis protein CcsB
VPAAAASQDASQAAAAGGGVDVLERVDVDTDRVARFARIGVVLTTVAAGVQFVAVAARGLAADPVRVPWGNMYEFTLTATLMVTLGYLLLYRRFSLDWLSPVVTGFVLVTLMVDVLLLYTPVVPLRDALQSPWLVIHVIAAIIATGAFTLGGMCSALYLVKERWPGTRVGGYLSRLPDLDALDRMAYRTQAFAFPVWTFAALIAGPIWAQHAWGRYWGWDPKEVWAFITWVVYAAYLHARATAGWKGRAAAIVALIGLATLWFNFVGINFFFGSGSMHSYA